MSKKIEISKEQLIIYKDATIFLDRKKELIDSYMKRYSLNV